MATYYVRKNGSGTHTTIQNAITDASAGDTIDIEAGTFDENLDVYKGVILQGAGKEATIITGAYRSSVVKEGTWTLGSTTLNFANTTGFQKGRIITGTGIPANTRILQVNATSLVISAAVTSTRSALTNATMAAQNDSTIRVRGSGAQFKNLKVVGYDGTSAAVEVSTIYFRNSGLGSAACSNFLVENCEIEAKGEYALLADSGASVGNGTVKNCVISGKTFTGSNPESGNQFTVLNVPRQLVVFQSVNLPITFINNKISGTTGGLTVSGVASYNSAVTIDAANSIVTGNSFDGYFGYGYALRVRNTATVESNVNNIKGDQLNSGYLIGPSVSQQSGVNIGTNVSFTEGLLLTASQQQQAGDPIKATMNKNLLKTTNKVASSAYFSSEANWKLVSYVYKKVGSSQRIVTSFSDFEGEVQRPLKANMNSGEVFQLVKIIISDPSRTFLVVRRAEVENAESYDFILK